MVSASDLETGDPHSGVLVGHGGEQRFGQRLRLLVKCHGDGFSQLDAAAATLLEMQSSDHSMSGTSHQSSPPS